MPGSKFLPTGPIARALQRAAKVLAIPQPTGKRNPSKPSLRVKLLAAACVILYVWAFSQWVQKTPAAAWLALLPAIAVGWSCGVRAGFAAGVALLPLDALLSYLLGETGWLAQSDSHGVWAHSLAPLAGAVFGQMHELSAALLSERAARLHAERECQLARRSLDATLELLAEQSAMAEQNLQDRAHAEDDARGARRELARINRHLAQSSRTDSWSELPNRRAAQDRLHAAWLDMPSRRRPVSCIALTVDDLGSIRGTNGHETADSVLQETLEIVRDGVRRGDELFSLGGEEFLLVCADMDRADALECAERLRALIEVNTVPLADAGFHVTLSVGVATSSADSAGPDSLLRAARQALAAAHELGPNHVIVFDASLAGDLQPEDEAFTLAAV